MTSINQESPREPFQKKNLLIRIAAAIIANPISSISAFIGASTFVTVIWLFSFNPTRGKPLSVGEATERLIEKVVPSALKDRFLVKREPLFASAPSAAKGQTAAGSTSGAAGGDEGSTKGSDQAKDDAGREKQKALDAKAIGQLSMGLGAEGGGTGSLAAMPSAAASGAWPSPGAGRSAGTGVAQGGAGARVGRGKPGGRGGSLARALGAGGRNGAAAGAGPGSVSRDSGARASGQFAPGGAQGASGDNPASSQAPAPNNAGQGGSIGGAGGAAPAYDSGGSLAASVVGPAASLCSQMLDIYGPMLDGAYGTLDGLINDNSRHDYDLLDASVQAVGTFRAFHWPWDDDGTKLTSVYDDPFLPAMQALHDQIATQRQLLSDKIRPCLSDLPNLDPTSDDYPSLASDCYNSTKILLAGYDGILNGYPSQTQKKDVWFRRKATRQRDRTLDLYYKSDPNQNGLRDLPPLNAALKTMVQWIDDIYGSAKSQFLGKGGTNPGTALMSWMHHIEDRIHNCKAHASDTDSQLQARIRAFGKGSPWAQMRQAQPSVVEQAGAYVKECRRAIHNLRGALKAAHADPNTRPEVIAALRQAIADVKVAREAWKRFPRLSIAEQGPAVVEFGKVTAIAAGSYAKAYSLVGGGGAYSSDDDGGDQDPPGADL